MSIIRNRTIRRDAWQHVADGAPLPAGDVIVSLTRWQSEREALGAHRGRLGVRLEPHEDIEPLVPALGRLALVALRCASFADGRPYSRARLLRTRHGFGGELRAFGDVFRDQLVFLARCGFDSFALREGEDAEAALAAFDEISVRFQPAVDNDDLPVWRRHRAPARQLTEEKYP